MSISMSFKLNRNLFSPLNFQVQNTFTKPLKSFQLLNRLSCHLSENSIFVVHKGTWSQSDCEPTVVSILFADAGKQARPVM